MVNGSKVILIDGNFLPIGGPGAVRVTSTPVASSVPTAPLFKKADLSSGIVTSRTENKRTIKSRPQKFLSEDRVGTAGDKFGEFSRFEQDIDPNTGKVLAEREFAVIETFSSSTGNVQAIKQPKLIRETKFDPVTGRRVEQDEFTTLSRGKKTFVRPLQKMFFSAQTGFQVGSRQFEAELRPRDQLPTQETARVTDPRFVGRVSVAGREVPAAKGVITPKSIFDFQVIRADKQRDKFLKDVAAFEADVFFAKQRGAKVVEFEPGKVRITERPLEQNNIPGIKQATGFVSDIRGADKTTAIGRIKDFATGKLESAKSRAVQIFPFLTGTITGSVKTIDILKDVRLATISQEKVTSLGLDLPFREFEATLQCAGSDAGFIEKTRFGAFRGLTFVERGFTKAARFIVEKPFETAVIGATLEIGGGLLTKTLRFSGLPSKVASLTTGASIIGGIGAIKEISDPGSVLSKGGFVETSTELGTFALGFQAGKTLFRSAKFLDPRFIPFSETAGEVGTPISRVKTGFPEEIPLFTEAGFTRRGTAFEEALDPQAFQKQTFFSTTGATPKEFFQLKPFETTLKQVFGKQIDVPVKSPEVGEVGGERLKFKEEFFFVSRGEAFPVFGESSVQRLGEPFTRAEELRSPIKRFKEIFLRPQEPTILRFQEETALRFPKTLEKQIQQGNFGSVLRTKLGQEIRLGEKAFRPGPRTAGVGQGELEFVLPQETPIIRLEGPQRFTFLPGTQTFAPVIDVGLKQGKAIKGTFNLKQRLVNIGDVAITSLTGFRFFKSPPGTTKQASAVGKVLDDIASLRLTPGRTVPRRTGTDIFRTNARGKDLTRDIFRDFTRARDRNIDRPRERIIERTRERGIQRPRERTRERPRERIRERITPRDIGRDITRELERIVPRERPPVRQPPRRVPPRRPPVRKPPTPREPPTPVIRRQPIKSGTKSGGFDVLIRAKATKSRGKTIKGRLIKANVEGPLTFQSANDLGANITDRTLGRTYTIRKSKSKTKPKRATDVAGQFNARAQKFRKPIIKGIVQTNSPLNIEKIGNAIDTPSEKRGLRVARAIADRKRRLGLIPKKKKRNKKTKSKLLNTRATDFKLSDLI